MHARTQAVTHVPAPSNLNQHFKRKLVLKTRLENFNLCLFYHLKGRIILGISNG
jgi:hypothetical protein